MNALSGDELLAWVDRTSEGWRGLVREHPEALAIECDVMNVGTVARLLQHIVAVELRCAQRLAGVPESSYEEVGYGSGEEIFVTHTRAMEMIRDLLEKENFDLEEQIRFATRSMGELTASRRTVLMHSTRHYAQLATMVRQHGIAPGWPMDYLFMAAERVTAAGA